MISVLDPKFQIYYKILSSFFVGFSVKTVDTVGSVHSILHEDLGMKSRKKVKAQGLNENAKKKRLTRCKRLQRRFARGRHRFILFTDEKWFDILQSHNPQNDRQWSEEPLPLEERVVERTQKPKQVMVWAGVGHGVKIPLFFIPEGVKVDGPGYREFLRKKRDNGDWPPNSPDLNVMDFSIWSILEACSKPHQSIEALKKSLAAWNKIPQDVIDRAVDDFPKRLQKCIDAQGGHFENK
uniref:DDE-1 domain-containing protein n=1 Tax=Acrobeloides nanus TaxID=290746 RepID=A0A914CT80_9BILA